MRFSLAEKGKTMAKADEVKKALDVCINQGFGSKCHECVYREYEGGFCIDALMKDALDVINQTEVVRCKDCKHFIPFDNECYEPHNYYTEEGYREVCDNDFCSYGERKNDEN